MAIQGITGDGVFMPIVLEFIIFAVAAVIFLVVNPIPKQKEVEEGK